MPKVLSNTKVIVSLFKDALIKVLRESDYQELLSGKHPQSIGEINSLKQKVESVSILKSCFNIRKRFYCHAVKST